MWDMDIGILSVRDEKYPPNQRLMEAASQSGHRAKLIHTRDCLSEIEGGRLKLNIRGCERPDVLLPRIGATINDYALGVVRQFELSGVPVVNGSGAIFLARHKFLSLQALTAAGLPVPNTRLVVNPSGFHDAVKGLGGYPVVAKMPSSRQGSGVVRVDSPVISEFIMENLRDNSRGVLVQEYMAPEGRRDIRAFVVDGGVLGAMELRPNIGDFRSNIHLTGMGKGVTLDPDMSELAIRSARALGLEIAGTDILVDRQGSPKIIEVNYSPGFRGLEAATGLDIASRIIGYAVTKYGGRV
ncbi:MAG: ATP-grasp protein [Thermodesulfobacteriota bacterium]|nr:ATP-grasp protein [Thermodesulfobacteriota bacterium]